MSRRVAQGKRAAIADRTVDLWWIEKPGRAHFEAAIEILSAAERRRLTRMKVAARRTEFVAGRAALRSILGGYLGTRPADIDIVVAESGKPELAGGRFAFSLAHSADRAVVAVALRGAVGVDLETARALQRPQRLAETLLSPSALAAWHALPPARQAGPILHAWTTMEAVIKALGRSLPGALRSVQIEGAGTEWPRLAAIDGSQPRARNWTLAHATLPGGSIAAVAHDGPIDRIRVRTFRWTDVARRSRL